MTLQDDKTLARASALIGAANLELIHASVSMLNENPDVIKRLTLTSRELRYAADLIDDIKADLVASRSAEDPAVAEASEQDAVG